MRIGRNSEHVSGPRRLSRAVWAISYDYGSALMPLSPPMSLRGGCFLGKSGIQHDNDQSDSIVESLQNDSFYYGGT